MQEHVNHKKLSAVQWILLKAQHNYKETWSTTASVADHSLTIMHMVTMHHLKVVIYSTTVMIHVLYVTGLNILLWFVNMAVSIVQHRHLLLWCKLLFVYEYAIKCNTKNIYCGNLCNIQILLKSGLVNLSSVSVPSHVNNMSPLEEISQIKFLVNEDPTANMVCSL